MENRITQRDFRVGQIVTCRDNEDIYYLTPGKEYKITDVDIHFPYAICIKDDNKNGGFYPINLFIDEMKELRDRKINEILK